MGIWKWLTCDIDLKGKNINDFINKHQPIWQMLFFPVFHFSSIEKTIFLNMLTLVSFKIILVLVILILFWL